MTIPESIATWLRRAGTVLLVLIGVGIIVVVVLLVSARLPVTP